MVRVRVASGEQAAIDAASAVLRAGGVVAYPTDTLYGLAVDPRRDDAVRKLFAIKGRAAAAALPLIAASPEQASLAGNIGPAEWRLATRFWPGALSLVVPARDPVSRRALGGGTTVAVRVPDHAVARALAAGLGFAITATSANLSGHPPTASPDEVAAALGERLDLLLDGGEAPGGPPSTIVDMRSGRPSLVRAGAIPFDRVLRSVE
ncbi:MAG: threonylcarbamoyl-AMP synthase [Acidobacteria bacterium RIFCSPLOWO2_02_FULL_67_36]|nr:MAG: threonylcarbamoyl-AMP synthase [Acidobacteria bacterium RIFCSPLOWO2_02_FULL_67_36]OFW25069.1 MAG: threonylcarbamoyl-AMP synthase [Acidobacteria bacterium RIFCSPLOWO2_12_FULL_66_21]